jgi:signal transduction histidine kinase
MVNEDDYEPVRILKTAFRAQHDKYYELHVVSSMVEEDDLIEDLSYSIVWLYIILLASILLVNNILLKRIWKPFYQIVDRLKHFNLEAPDTFPAPDTKVAEFQMLNESVTALLDRTVATFNSQKQFIENASHELQTPLAISINKLELLAEKESMSESDLREISSVIQSLERLTRLNRTLLLLSRIHNRQFEEQTAVNFNKVTDEAVVGLADLAEYKLVKVSAEHPDMLTRHVNPELASIMVSNLLKNAIVHNVEGGTVTVTVNFSSITFENTSKVHALDAGQIFKRFYKNSDDNTSTGLGLALVKTIADICGFTVQYTYNGKHMFAIGL